jgi:hypothetical protein
MLLQIFVVRQRNKKNPIVLLLVDHFGAGVSRASLFLVVAPHTPERVRSTKSHSGNHLPPRIIEEGE